MDQLMARPSADSLNPALSEIPTISIAFVTPPDTHNDVAEDQMDRNPVSLRNDPGDVFKTPTVCDTTAKNPPGSPSARRMCPNQGDSPPPNLGSISATTSHGTLLSLHAAGDGPGREDKEPDLEATVVWSGDARATIKLEDSANVKRWKEEIDMLPVFAGLVSAVVTGFLTESTKALRPEPMAGTVAILQRISTQLPNSAGDISDLLVPADFVLSSKTVQIGCLWFTSLLLSLGVAFVSIFVKRWIQLGRASGLMTAFWSQPRRKVARTHRRAASHVWRVRVITTALPILLLFALVLFCAGLSCSP